MNRRSIVRECSNERIKWGKTMKIISRNIGAVMCAGLVLATGCVVEQGPDGNYHVRIDQKTISDAIELHNLKQRALHGDRISQYTLGSCYANGRGCVQN